MLWLDPAPQVFMSLSMKPLVPSVSPGSGHSPLFSPLFALMVWPPAVLPAVPLMLPSVGQGLSLLATTDDASLEIAKPLCVIHPLSTSQAY